MHTHLRAYSIVANNAEQFKFTTSNKQMFITKTNFSRIANKMRKIQNFKIISWTIIHQDTAIPESMEWILHSSVPNSTSLI